MTVPPPPGAPFPFIGGRSLDPSRQADDPGQDALRRRMLDERVVFVSGALDDGSANRAAMELMTLDANGDGPVQLHLDCGEGTLGAALVVMDVIDQLGIEVHALCAGQVAGPPVGVLAVCRVRRATPHARVRLVEPHVELEGRRAGLEAAVAHHRRQLRRFCERMAAATGRTCDVIESDMSAGRYLSAEEAARYGLVDEIVRPDARVIEFPRRFGFGRR